MALGLQIAFAVGLILVAISFATIALGRARPRLFIVIAVWL
jgi:hypothetical protein